MKISCCRICSNNALEPILDLGKQCLSGFFPETWEQNPPRAPLVLAKCPECHLVQLQHSFDVSMLYGEHYGYCSSLNSAMVGHLKTKIKYLQTLVRLESGDVVLDIGSNDGTSLSFYPPDVRAVGFDPSAAKFRHFYRKDALLIVDFFNAEAFKKELGGEKAKIVTSIAMFYDLPNPQEFVLQIKEVLADDGVWHFEQSYMPAMLQANSYDTVCHEHLEYYSLGQVKYMLDRADMKIIDVQFNDVNGGSFAVTASHKRSYYAEAGCIPDILANESEMGLGTMAPYLKFREQAFKHADAVKVFFEQMKRAGKLVLGYGASTKGNILLQFCELGPKDLPAIAEVNSFKFGKFTPGSLIPIISEDEAIDMGPDVFFVLPWHFKENLIKREQDFLTTGGKMLFPLPNMELVNF